MNFVVVAVVSAVVLGHSLTKEPSFDWFKSHSPCLNHSSQITKFYFLYLIIFFSSKYNTRLTKLTINN